MISDVLSEAVEEIDEYLVHPGTADCYVGAIRERIMRLRTEMDAVRVILDTPPSGTLTSEGGT